MNEPAGVFTSHIPDFNLLICSKSECSAQNSVLLVLQQSLKGASACILLLILSLPLRIIFRSRESQEVQGCQLGLPSRGHKNNHRFLGRMFYNRLVSGFCHGDQTRSCVGDVESLMKKKTCDSKLRAINIKEKKVKFGNT